MDDDEQEQPETSRLPGRGASEVEIKHAAVLLLSEAGMGPKAISMAVSRHEKTICRVLPKLRRESLQSPRKLALASKCVEQIMTGFVGTTIIGPDKKVLRDEQGKPVIQYDDRVKASDAKAAAELCYKASGELKDGNAGTVQTFIQVNMNGFRKQE